MRGKCEVDARQMRSRDTQMNLYLVLIRSLKWNCKNSFLMDSFLKCFGKQRCTTKSFAESNNFIDDIIGPNFKFVILTSPIDVIIEPSRPLQIYLI